MSWKLKLRGRRMNKEQFDYVWKVALIVILLVSIVYMFYEFSTINKEGMACKNAPFIWGKQKALEQGFYCSYYCSYNNVSDIMNGGEDYAINFSKLNISTGKSQ